MGCSDSPLVVTNLNTIATSGGPSSCISSDGSDPTTCRRLAKTLVANWQRRSCGWECAIFPTCLCLRATVYIIRRTFVCQVDESGGSGCDPRPARRRFSHWEERRVSTSGAWPESWPSSIQKYGRQGMPTRPSIDWPASAAGTSIFHDITADGNRVACESPDPDCVDSSGSNLSVWRDKRT